VKKFRQKDKRQRRKSGAPSLASLPIRKVSFVAGVKVDQFLSYFPALKGFPAQPHSGCIMYGLSTPQGNAAVKGFQPGPPAFELLDKVAKNLI
jgi:hypothetical protein